MIEGIYYILCLIIIIKSDVWIITHCLGLGHETMVSAVCLSLFLRAGTNIQDNEDDKYDVIDGLQTM